MHSLIQKYFVLHKHLVLPGIGSLQIISQPAIIDNENQLHAPVNTLEFNGETTLLADKNFYHFLSLELGVEQIEAIKKFHEFIYEIKASLTEGSELLFTGIGTISKQSDGTFSFQQEKNKYAFFPVIQLPEKPVTIVQNGSTDSEISTPDEIQNDKWWIYAIVLTVLAIAAIIIKFNFA